MWLLRQQYRIGSTLECKLELFAEEPVKGAAGAARLMCILSVGKCVAL